MNLPRFSVHRPIFTSMVTLMVLVIGAVSVSRLPIDFLPDVELPSLSIRTEYENASPEVMERLITQVVEEAVAVVPGVKEITSVSAEGISDVRVAFTWGTDIDAATNDVRDRLDREADEMPEEVTRPQIRKFDVASFPVVVLGVTSKLDPVELTELVDKQVQYRFERLNGVASVDLFGSYDREVRISLDPARLKALNLPLNQIISALRDANLDLPAGEIDEGRFEVALRAPAEFRDLEEIRRTVVANRQGAPVTLEQIATVEDTYQRVRRIVRINGERGLRLGIRKQADANTVEVANRALAEMENVNRDFPQITVTSVLNQGNFIERSIDNLANSVLYGGMLAIIVLLFFLRSLRSTIVIALAIPISIIATFAMIYLAGFTLNLMTLGGLALGVGMMVDNSIVVLENIFRRRQELGEASEIAAVRGTAEVGPAIVASTLTTLVIFLPLVFVRGVAGVLFAELAYVIVFSLLCSLAVALSLVPMLASKLLGEADASALATSTAKAQQRPSLAQRFFDGMDNAYRDLLHGVLRHRLLTIGVSLLLLALCGLLGGHIGTEFMPPSDEGEVRVNGEMEVATRLELVDERSRRIEDIVAANVPEAVSMVASIGPSFFRADAGAATELRIALVPVSERERSNTQVADDLRKKLAGQVPGMTIRTRAPQGQFLLDRILGGDAGLSVEVRGFDLPVLELLAQRAAQVMQDVPGVTDVKVSREAGAPQALLRIDRDKTAAVGLTVRQVAEALETAVAGSRAGEYRTQGDSYRILVQLADAQSLQIDEILDLTLRVPSGQDVALRNLVSVNNGTGPTVIDRKDQQRLIAVTANIEGRDLGTLAAELQDKLHDIPRPVGYDLLVAGNFEEQQEAFAELLVSLALSLVLVYMVMACQYESLRDPLVVMFSVPLAAVGVVITLFLTETTFNLQSFIGTIMLGGIVVNNAILLVDQAGQLMRQEKWSVRDAVAEAGRRRLRPILMTTLTTILGLLPLALGIGEGADAQAPLARAVVGGLTGSTLITLVLIPAVFSLFHPQRPASAPAAAEADDAGPG